MGKQNFNINASDHPLIAAKQASGGPWGRPVVFCFLIWRACYFYGFYGNLVCNCAACFMSGRIYISVVLYRE